MKFNKQSQLLVFEVDTYGRYWCYQSQRHEKPNGITNIDMASLERRHRLTHSHHKRIQLFELIIKLYLFVDFVSLHSIFIVFFVSLYVYRITNNVGMYEG